MRVRFLANHIAWIGDLGKNLDLVFFKNLGLDF